MTQENSIPSKQGFFMPPEWHPHEATWLSWPHNEETWPDLKPVEEAYIEIVKALHTGEKVNILVNNKKNFFQRKNFLKIKNLKNVFFYEIPTIDAWIRDYGPNFIIKKNFSPKNFFSDISFNNWIFNAWGNKYDDLKEDNIIPEKINKFLKLKSFNPNIVLEGGSIEVNGKGICMTTEQCLLNKNRNPELSKEEIEKYLKGYLGVQKVLWLKNGIEGDDTDGHIDDIARFVNENTILICSTDENDINYDILGENYQILKKISSDMRVSSSHSLTNQRNFFSIVKIPMPEKNIKINNKILPASYANFYIGNKVVLVPVFGDKNDNAALDAINKCFPDRKVAGIGCRKLVEGLGAIHCLTQQQPKL